jgi:integrase
MYGSVSPPHLGFSAEYNTESRICPGGGEYPGGLAQSPHGISSGVEAQTSRGSEPFSEDGYTSGGPIRVISESPTSRVLFSPTRHESPAGRQSGDGVGRAIWIRVPTNLLGSDSPRKDRKVELYHSIDSPKLASPLLVPENSGAVNRSTSDSPRFAGSVVTGRRETAPCPASGVSADGMEAERRRLVAAGFSEAVIDTMQGSIRPSSAKQYQQMWKIFVHWCMERHADPCTVPIPVITEFLQSLLDQGMAFRTIGVYRSAISKFHVPVMGVPIGKLPEISRFMKGVFNKRPPCWKLLPTWDINIVLKFLQKAPFEPLKRASLHALTFKTIFLVAITSARRCSELQALGRSEPYLRFEEGTVRLRTVGGFLPKTANPSNMGADICLPSLPTNKKLCVVRTVKQYIKVTKNLMQKQNVSHNHLFVCYGIRNQCKPVSKRTISGWLVKVIKAAYAAAGKTLDGSVRAHSTRAQATTWAVFNGASLEDIMKAADWRDSSTFIAHYSLNLWKQDSASFGRAVLQAPSKQ